MMVTAERASDDLGADQDQKCFILDSGAFDHIVTKLSYLINVIQLAELMILSCASKSAPLTATHCGDLLVEVQNRFGDVTIIFL